MRGCDVEITDLGVAERRALERVAGDADAKPFSEKPSAARDQVMYELELDTSAGLRRLVFDEMNVPKGLGPVVAALQKRSKPTAP